VTAFIPFSEEDDILRFRVFLSREVDGKNLTLFPGTARITRDSIGTRELVCC